MKIPKVDVKKQINWNNCVTLGKVYRCEQKY